MFSYDFCRSSTNQTNTTDCYYLLSIETYSVQDGAMRCAEGTHLVRIDDQQEADDLATFYSNTG